MAALNRAWAAEADQAGHPELAALHRTTADAHDRTARDIQQGAQPIAGTRAPAPEATHEPAGGARLYASTCAPCHGPTAQGMPGLFPPLADNPVVTGPSAPLIALLHDGKTGPLSIRGVDYDGAMPSFAGRISAEELAAVLTYVRSHFGNHAGAISARQLSAAGW
jgi:mono/diheme cytochrome c family protein